MKLPNQGPWYYEQIDLGYNYRLTDLQAALGIAQMRRLEGFVARRQEIARRYDALLEGLPLKTQRRDPESVSGLHLYVVQLDLDRVTAGRRAVFDRMRASGIGVNVHYIPIHTQPYYRDLGFRDGDFPAAEAYYAGAITLPMFPDLTDEDQDRVVAALKAAIAS